MATKPFGFELKELDDKTGVFTGYGSTFGGVDSYGDTIARGAFTDSLREHDKKGRRVAMLWQHDAKSPIGIWTSIKEDEHGLRVSGRLALEVAKAREARDLMKLGALQGLSIGFRTKEATPLKDGGRLLRKVELWEISLVTFPANESARVLSVNAADISSIRDYERLLLDCGFSRSRARILAQAWNPPSGDGDEDSRSHRLAMMEGLRAFANKLEIQQRKDDEKRS